MSENIVVYVYAGFSLVTPNQIGWHWWVGKSQVAYLKNT